MAASALSLTTALGQSVEMPAFSATEVKNEFGRVLETAFAQGAVAITRHDAPKAVLLSLDAWRALTAAAPAPADPLAALGAEFEALLAGMQTAEARAAGDALFDATPEALGAAAVAAARG
ncbi:type II toxin-antitoxin system Phd/YefM family antitoxin [Derxia lacustris]|uniref:type II toxin-antitoxin system Phd/YefM family antitoxin n=1 Tax=Derxia lacustris TaxID=764842 RepID=UPI000A17082A|nr:type II toxin-antitoxin system Phd/YefM family antitoxin [Derxia lacustris]